MKIGLSYSRCVRDIVEGKVDIDDVLVVIARTDFDPHDDEQWQAIWQGYAGGSDAALMRGFFGGSNPEWHGYGDEDEDRFRSVSIELWESGKFHQPRKFGAHPTRMPYYWIEANLLAEDINNNPTVKRAFEQYQILAGLTKSNKVKDNF